MQLRLFLLTPFLAVALAGCGSNTVYVEVTPTPEPFQGITGSGTTPMAEGTTPKAGATATTPGASPTAAASPTKPPVPAATDANEVNRGTATVPAQGSAATAAPTQPPAATATPIPKPTNTRVPTTLIPPTATAVPKPAQNCDPSYPTVCIPPPPPDLDCKDIPYRRFGVLPPDPHRFDSDKDGIGCES